MIKALEKMPSDKPLNTIDLRTLLVFKRQLTPAMDPEVVSLLTLYKNEIVKKNGYEIYTRADHFIKSIASAYALARSLSEGVLGPDSRTINLNKNDIAQAATFYQIVIMRHNGQTKSGSVKRVDFYNVGASQGQKFLLQYAKGKFLMGISPNERKVTVQELLKEFKLKYPEMDFNLAIRGLIEARCVVWDGENIMYIDEWLPDEIVNSIYGNHSNFLTTYAEQLRMASLLQEDSNNQIRCDWVTKLPSIPQTDAVEKLIGVLKSCAPRVPTRDELKTALSGLTQEEAHNLIMYLYLSGDIVPSGDNVRLSELSAYAGSEV